MTNLKWFSGGKDRKLQAIKLIDDLLSEFANESKSMSLQNVLRSYKDELNKEVSSVPFILSRMNIDISDTLKKSNIHLSNSQSNKLKELSSLSNIRYGY